MINGCSGVAIYFGFYFSLYNVWNTVFSLALFVLLDQNVAFNKEKYMADATTSNTEYQVAASYDPVAGQSFSLSNIFDREGYIARNKIPMSPDGSIYNLSLYYMYVRDAIMKRATTAYVLQYIWSFIAGGITYLICFYALSGVIAGDGHINSFHNSGTACLFCIIVVHHV